MAFIRNTDKLIEGSSKLFFSNVRAKAAVQSDLDLLASDISAEESARMSEDSGIKLRLDVIEGGSAVVGSIAKAQADAQAYADTQIAALVNSAPSVLDTLKELADAIGGDADFATTIAGQIGDVDDKVDQEISDREAAISALDSRLDSLELDSVTQTYVDGEISSLDSRLDVIEGLDSVEGSVAKAEKDAKDYADSLDSAMDSRVSSLEADPTTKAYVDGIQSALDGRLDVLEQDPTTKTYVDGEVSGEESRAMAAEGLLDGRLDVLEQDPTTKSYVDGQIGNLDGRLDIIEGADSVEGSVAKAEKDAKDYADSLDSAMDSRVSALESDPTTQSYVDGIQSALDARLDIIEGLDSVEGSVAKAEKDAKDYADSLDSAMDARVSSLESDPVTKTYVDGEVSSLDSRLDVIEGVGEGSVSKAEQDAKDYADAQIAALVNSAPAVLDTLKELSDALGGDENFATTVSNQIGGLDSRLDVLEGVGEGSVSKAEQDAKDYADSLNSAMDSRVDALELDPVTKTYVDAMTTSDISEGSNLYYTQARFDSAFSAKSTSNLSEGSNLYYTQARFDSAFAGKSSTDLAEGSKLFFTDARARSASVVNSSSGSQTDQAMSVSAAKSYIDSADNARLKLDGSVAMTGQLAAFAGTQTAPGIAFSGVSNYGIWYNSAGPQLSLVHAGTARLSTTSTGIAVNGVLAATSVNANGVSSSSTITLSAPTNANLLWTTDGAGNIGAAAASRPDQIYAKTRITTPALTLTSFSGVLKATAGVVAGSASTSDLTEGINLYYTQARFDSAFGAKSTSNLSEGSNLYFTDSRARSAAVINSSAGSEINQAMSVSAGKSYTDSAVSSEASLRSAEDLLMVKLDGSRPVTGELSMQGGMKVKQSEKSANYSILSSDYIIGVTSVSGGKVMTLPTAASVGAGKVFMIKDQSGLASPTDYIRISCQGSEKVDGQSSYDIDAAYESVMVYCNGSNWFIV